MPLQASSRADALSQLFETAAPADRFRPTRRATPWACASHAAKALLELLHVLAVAAALERLDQQSALRLQVRRGEIERRVRQMQRSGPHPPRRSPTGWAPCPTARGRPARRRAHRQVLLPRAFLPEVALDEVDPRDRLHRQQVQRDDPARAVGRPCAVSRSRARPASSCRARHRDRPPTSPGFEQPILSSISISLYADARGSRAASHALTYGSVTWRGSTPGSNGASSWRRAWRDGAGLTENTGSRRHHGRDPVLTPEGTTGAEGPRAWSQTGRAARRRRA